MELVLSIYWNKKETHKLYQCISTVMSRKRCFQRVFFKINTQKFAVSSLKIFNMSQVKTTYMRKNWHQKTLELTWKDNTFSTSVYCSKANFKKTSWIFSKMWISHPDCRKFPRIIDITGKCTPYGPLGKNGSISRLF